MTFVNQLRKICPSNFISEKKDLYVYAHDTSQNPNEVILPLCVVFPRNTKEVANVCRFCYENNIKLFQEPKAQTIGAEQDLLKIL